MGPSEALLIGADGIYGARRTITIREGLRWTSGQKPATMQAMVQSLFCFLENSQRSLSLWIPPLRPFQWLVRRLRMGFYVVVLVRIISTVNQGVLEDTKKFEIRSKTKRGFQALYTS